MRTYTHIIFKNTSNLDFIIPYYSLKFKSGKFDKLIIIVWDLNDSRIKKNLIKLNKLFKINLKIYYLRSFFGKNKLLRKLSENFFLKKKFFINKLSFNLVNLKRIEKIIKNSDKIYLDNKEFSQIYFLEILLRIIKVQCLEIILVPHAPHYRKLGEEIDKDNLILLKEYSIKYKVLFSNRKNFDLLKKKYSSIYYGLPCSKLNFPRNTNYNKEKNVGIILRPFIKKFNSKSLQRYDYYISSYEDNIFFLNIAKELNNKGYNIFFRLHPSTDIENFKNYYGNKLNEFNFNYFSGSIYEFFLNCNNIVSFHSTSLIYAVIFKCKIFLYKNNLSKKIYKNWPILKTVYQSLTVEFTNLNEINFKNNIFNKKLNLTKKVLKKIW